MDEEEGVLVMYNFDSAWERTTSSMNPKTAWGTLIRHTLAFFATKVACECDELAKGNQWVVMEFGF